MRWTEEHDIVLCREVLVAQPYQYRPQSAERGSAWTSIANELNAVQEIRFCVTQKAVRDRMKLLVERHKKKTREEESASGISPEESEIDEALDTIIELIDDAEQHFEKAWPEIQDNMAICIRNVLPHSLFKMADLYRLGIANVCFSNFQRFSYINPSSARRKHHLNTRSCNRTNFKTVQMGQTSSRELYSYLISSHIPDS
ncbi:Hypothetical predicted protein [Paramuricea clavata]|uniref:Uncharacterized protein n=1 Tax=Paramuricea clavata TaxID=317549 RepID=A0A6S7GK35_PARCT|nr:Hypothetical predicted protein [Paramuricea clavata]